MNRLSLGLGALLTVFMGGVAQAATVLPAQSTTCITAEFSATGSAYWKSVILKLTNNCGKTVDFQNATVSFKTKTALNTSFWGDFSPISYPDNNLTIGSQNQGGGTYLATLNLHFPNYAGATSKLPAGKSIQLKYGTSADDHVNGTTNVYLEAVVGTGTLTLKNVSSKPANVSQTYALIHLTMNGQKVNDLQVAWGETRTITGLAAGSYSVSPENIADSNGGSYQGTAIPNTVTVAADNTVNSNITYAAVKQIGQVTLKLNALPQALNGYAKNPTVLLTQSPNGNSISQLLSWGTSATVGELKEGSTYGLSTPPISFNGYNCAALFTPATLVANATTPPLSNLTYQCAQVVQDSVTINVTGGAATLTSLKVTLTPNDTSAPIVQNVSLINGSGSTIVPLTDGVIYTFSADSVAGYAINYSPQPLTATASATETITLNKSITTGGGRIIGYVPGWKTPPTAQALANAGYTHVMIAFGVFSTTTPGVIIPAFDTVTKEYVQSLHQAGIKVILSLGGASSSVANTTVDFHQVLSRASSPDVFKQTFINSLNGLITQYGFDGFDIDIEQGFNAGGTFIQPQGDIAVLASIINSIHSQNPNLLITLAPQVANISATSGFDQTWGNYASLIMQTHDSLTWVGIQLYNTGCAFGIDQVCYGSDPVTNPDFTVAMATDLLANWPATVNGRATGFQSYVSYLKPSQLVIGYPAPNASGVSDGSPVTPVATIKRALQCLKTAVVSSTSCGSYVPPKAYGAIGGVFNWEVTYDQNNGFKFATDLKNCVINGLCN
jgi:chitinase